MKCDIVPEDRFGIRTFEILRVGNFEMFCGMVPRRFGVGLIFQVHPPILRYWRTISLCAHVMIFVVGVRYDFPKL